MKFLKNIGWTFMSNTLASLIKWLIIILIAQVLSPTEVGIYSLGFAITAPIALFANMKLRMLYISDENEDYKSYSASRKITSVFSIILIALIAVFFYPEFSIVILGLGLSKIIDLQSEMLYAIPHKKNDMQLIAKLLMGRQITTFIVFAVLLLTTKNLELAIIGMVISQMFYVISVEHKSINKYYSEEIVSSKEKNRFKHILKIGLPLGLVQFIVSFNSSYPRYVLEKHGDTEILGYFAAIAYLLVIGNMIMSPITQNFLPLLVKKYNRSEFSSVKKIIYLYLPLLAFIVGLVPLGFSILWGRNILSWIYGNEYGEFQDLLVIMCIVLTINCLNWCFDIALMAIKYLSIQPKISVIVLLVNLIISPILILQFGLYGAGYTLIFTSLLQLIMRAVFVVIRINRTQKEVFMYNENHS